MKNTLTKDRIYHPNQSSKVKELVQTGMFTAIICVLSQITIPTQPIPFTLSVFAIFLTGTLLPPRYAFLSALCYLILGAFGVPVFAEFQGGFHILTGLTGGYLAAYPIMAFVTALFTYRRKKAKLLQTVIGMLISLFLCYIIGTLWFVHVSETNFYYALTVCVFPFVFFDLFKIALAIVMSTIIRKALRNSLI